MNRRGSVAITVAICMVVLIGLAGFAIDLERLWALKSRLQTSLDAAALLAAREISSSTMQADATELFWSNFLPGAGGGSSQLPGVFGSTSATLGFAVSSDKSTVTITATATMPVSFIAILPGIPNTFTVSDQASATPGGSGLEVALVLDNTGSMAQSDGSTSQTKLQALQSAVGDLLNILYGPNNDTVPNLWVSVIPFVTGINVGNGSTQRSWLSSLPTAAQYKGGTTQYTWSGCVQARWANDDDETDVPPATHLFAPYFADDTYDKYGTDTGNRPTCYSQYAYSNTVCMGDNDWGAPSSVQTGSNPGVQAGLTFGPNRGCPTALLPLTASKNTILTMVDNLTTAYSGTIIGLGVQGGWFTLSPKWRGSGGWGNAVLPHNYMTQTPAPSPPIQKVVILVSDGDNTWGYAEPLAPGNQSPPATLYMPYGRLSINNNPLNINISGNLATTSNNADAVLDTRWQAVCTNMKNAGITIYVIGLGVSDTNARTQLTNCATSPSNYLESPTASTLAASFTTVGSQLSNIRLTQ